LFDLITVSIALFDSGEHHQKAEIVQSEGFTEGKVWMDGNVWMKFLGVDAGGTKTRLAVCNEKGKILAVGTGGPGNHYDVGMEGFKESLLKAMKDAGVEDWHFESAFLGVAGGGFSERSAGKIHEFLRNFLKADEISVINDCVVALRGALGMRKKGVIIVAGTGSMVIGVDEEGKIHRVGGWGHLLGDPGSAYDISLDALKMVMKYWEGRERWTPLVEEFKRQMGLGDFSDVLRYFYSEKHPKSHLASFAKMVMKHAEEGDEISREIVLKNVKELVEGVEPVCRKVNSDFVSYSGGVFKSEHFRKLVEEELKKQGYELSKPELPPVGGALMLAISKLKVVNEKILENLKMDLMNVD